MERTPAVGALAAAPPGLARDSGAIPWRSIDQSGAGPVDDGPPPTRLGAS
jgi:hypothetical protein